MKLVFSGMKASACVVLDNAHAIRVAGRVLSIGGPVVSVCEGDRWRVGSHAFDRVAVEGVVILEVEEALGSRTFGPFDGVWLRAREAGTGTGVLARFSPSTDAWLFDRHGKRSGALVVRTGMSDRRYSTPRNYSFLLNRLAGDISSF